MIRDKFSGVSLAGIPLSLFLKYYNLVRDKSENVSPFYINDILGVDLKLEPYYVVNDINSISYGQLISSLDYRYPAKALDKHMQFMREIYEGILSKDTIYSLYAQHSMLEKDREYMNDFFLTYDARHNTYEIISIIPYLEVSKQYIDKSDKEFSDEVEIFKSTENPNITFNVYNNKFQITDYVQKNQNEKKFDGIVYSEEDGELKGELVEGTAPLSSIAKVENEKLMVSDENTIPQIINQISPEVTKDVYHSHEFVRFNLTNLPELILSKKGNNLYRILVNESIGSDEFESGVKIPVKYKSTEEILVQQSVLDIRYVAKFNPGETVNDDIYTVYYLNNDKLTPTELKSLSTSFRTDNYKRYIEIDFPNDLSEKTIFFPITWDTISNIQKSRPIKSGYLQQVKLTRNNDKVFATIITALDTVSYSGDTNIVNNKYSQPKISLDKVNPFDKNDSKYKLLLLDGVTEYVDDLSKLEYHYGYFNGKRGGLIEICPFDNQFALSNDEYIVGDQTQFINNHICEYQDIYSIISVRNNELVENDPYFKKAYINTTFEDLPIRVWKINGSTVKEIPLKTNQIKMLSEDINIEDDVQIFALAVTDPNGNLPTIESLEIWEGSGYAPDNDVMEYGGQLNCETVIKIKEERLLIFKSNGNQSENILTLYGNSLVEEALFASNINNAENSLRQTNYRVYNEKETIYQSMPENTHPFIDLDDGASLSTMTDIINYFKKQNKFISLSGSLDKKFVEERYYSTMLASTNDVMGLVVKSELGQIIKGDISESVLNNINDDAAVMAQAFSRVISKSLGTFGDTSSKSPGKKKPNMSPNKIVLSKVFKSQNPYENIYNNISFRNSMNVYMNSNPTDEFSDNRDLISRLNEAELYPTTYKYALEQRARNISQKIQELSASIGIRASSDTEKPIYIGNTNSSSQISKYSRPLIYYKYCNFDRIVQPMSVLGVAESLLTDFQKLVLQDGKYIPALSSTGKAYKNIKSYLKTTAIDIDKSNIVQYAKENNTEKKIITAQSDYGTMLQYIDDVLNAGKISTDEKFTWEEVF